MMPRNIGLVVAIVVLGFARPARSHPLDLGYLRIENTARGVAVSLELDLKAAALALGVDPEALDGPAVRSQAPALASATYARAPIRSEQTPCPWAGAAAELTGRTVKISGAAVCAPTGTRRWVFPLVTEHRISSRFELMVKETVRGSERLTLVDEDHPEIELAGAAPASSVGFAGFLWSGIEHIGVAPSQWQDDHGQPKLPDGIDHILFLLALLLGGGTLLQLVGIASGFTLGHSITLALAALDVVRPPSSVIEPLIALSIALAAVDAFAGRFKNHRWKIATGFGLIHGFGFATALTHLELTTRGKITALFGYNLGVELGQVVIVLVIAPLVMLAYRNRHVANVAVKGSAAAVGLCGMYWFVQRAFG